MTNNSLSFSKHKPYSLFISLFLLGILASCSSLKDAQKKTTIADEKVMVTFLQINDFYEISALEGGKLGGASRIATLKKKLLAENPNTILVLAGDFLSPSLLGTLKWEGERIKGRQMVELLNLIGLDYAAFGNHEFDLDEASLQKRINESEFDWIATNIKQRKDNVLRPFNKVKNEVKEDIPTHRILEFKTQTGNSFRIGLISPCLDANKQDFVHYDDIYSSVQNELAVLKDQCDFVVSLSHLDKEDDLEMAKRFPAIGLIMGGHEHDNMKYQIGNTIMTKADANAKSAYVHRLVFDFKSKTTKIRSELVKLDEHIIQDEETEKEVKKWKEIESSIVRNMGFDPEEVLMNLPEPYDARELTIRNKPCTFGTMMAKALSKAFPGSDCALTNSGGVRVDDMLSNSLSQYDILRSLPYGGPVLLAEVKGDVLQKVLEAGEKNRGTGGYLQRDRAEKNKMGIWFIGSEPLDVSKTYKVAVNDYLISGKEKNLSFFHKDHSGILIISSPQANDLTRDIRLVIIDYLKKGGR